MAIPTYDQLKSKVLQIMKDGEIRSVRDLTEIIMPTLANEQEGLSDMQVMTRVAWACTYLRVAGLLEKLHRTKLVIIVNNSLTASGVWRAWDALISQWWVISWTLFLCNR